MLYFVPYVTSLVAVGWVWRWMYMPNGMFNDMLGRIALGPFAFLGDPDIAIYAIIVTTIWQGLGFQIIIFLAGLESIPAVYQEAAAIDGATRLAAVPADHDSAAQPHARLPHGHGRDLQPAGLHPGPLDEQRRHGRPAQQHDQRRALRVPAGVSVDALEDGLRLGDDGRALPR